MNLSLIVAIAENKAIGLNNNLLWHIPEDLKFFKAKTTGKTIIMGRKTFESFPNGTLPNRHHIILSKQSNYKVEGCDTYNNIEDILKILPTNEECFVIGGEAIYKLFMPYVNTMYITKVFQSFEADAFFPEFSEEDWKIESGPTEKSAKSGLQYQFNTYTKK